MPRGLYLFIKGKEHLFLMLPELCQQRILLMYIKAAGSWFPKYKWGEERLPLVYYIITHEKAVLCSHTVSFWNSSAASFYHFEMKVMIIWTGGNKISYQRLSLIKEICFMKEHCLPIYLRIGSVGGSTTSVHN